MGSFTLSLKKRWLAALNNINSCFEFKLQALACDWQELGKDEF
jgi:hypothetical protein